MKGLNANMIVSHARGMRSFEDRGSQGMLTSSQSKAGRHC